MTVTRLISVEDAAALAAQLIDNHEHLAPYEPHREPDYFTADGQRQVIEEALRQHEQGGCLPHVIVHDGRVVGRITLNSIVRGPFQSASVGYWLDGRVGGQGVGTAALREIIRVAFTELGLHRIEAATLIDNVRSQRVLLKNGFEKYGFAPRYLKIAGDWQDFLLYQVLNE